MNQKYDFFLQFQKLKHAFFSVYDQNIIIYQIYEPKYNLNHIYI